jgi:hypothetical protein
VPEELIHLLFGYFHRNTKAVSGSAETARALIYLLKGEVSGLPGNNNPGHKDRAQERAHVNMTRFAVKVSHHQSGNDENREKLEHDDEPEIRKRNQKRATRQQRPVLDKFKQNVGKDKQQDVDAHLLPELQTASILSGPAQLPVQHRPYCQEIE